MHNIHTSNVQRIQNVPTDRNIHILFYEEVVFWRGTK